MKRSKASKSALLKRTIDLGDLDRWNALPILLDARSRLKNYYSARIGLILLNALRISGAWRACKERGLSGE